MKLREYLETFDAAIGVMEQFQSSLETAKDLDRVTLERASNITEQTKETLIQAKDFLGYYAHLI